MPLVNPGLRPGLSSVVPTGLEFDGRFGSEVIIPPVRVLWPETVPVLPF
jgi:hypothetical protein